MIKASAISATLTLALLGCAGSAPKRAAPGGGAPEPEATPQPAGVSAPVTASEGPVEGSKTPDSAAAAPLEVPPGSDEETAQMSTGVGAAPAGVKLPAGRTHVEGTMPKTGSVRTGAGNCCGQGTCGPCVPPERSVRKGASSCCGQGTCGPC